jgi:hypothetical protein
MNAWLFRLTVLAALVAFAAPAYARNWVDMGSDYWIDRDSISRNGDWVYYYLDWKDPGPPAQEGGPLSPNKAYNCVTWYLANVAANGELTPDGFSSEFHALEADMAALYSSILCN